MNEFPLFFDYDTSKTPCGKIILDERAEAVLGNPNMSHIIGPQIVIMPTESKVISFGLFLQANLKNGRDDQIRQWIEKVRKKFNIIGEGRFGSSETDKRYWEGYAAALEDLEKLLQGEL